uniref:Centrosomal protein 78 n=1 Tax=Cyprinus carpio TaxID=7962 RepID=A0A8C2JTA4_CYPCA
LAKSSSVVKHQAMRRHSAAWVETLRYRKAEFEAMSGLRRITLNDNILIGDQGVTALSRELTEDLWVKAVDLQRCGISNEGARVLEQMLQSNSTLCVLDIRRNPLVLLDHLMLFSAGSRRSSSVNSVWRPPRPGSVGYVPWRTAARQYQLTIQCSSSLHTQVELEECRLRLAEERNNRLKTNSRLVELELENERLRSLNQSLSEAHLSASVLEDERVLESIESSFQKFHAFLDLLKDAGLGQFASMAGIDQSDFGLLGHPQLSSTERTHVGQENQRNEERRESLAVKPPANTEDVLRPRSQQEVPLSPVRLCRASPPSQEPLEFEAPERSRESSYSSKHRSVSSDSPQSKASKSSRANGSVCSALNSRASSLSQLGSGSQRSAAGLVGL